MGGKLVAVLGAWVLGFVAIASAEPCYRTIAGPPTIETRMVRTHDRIAVAMPEYDPAQDFLFHFYPDGHSVFYTGGYFQESGANEPKPEETIIAHGMSVRVRVGPAYVRRLVEELEKRTIARAVKYYTCHQRLLLVLHAAGIHTAKGPALFGTTLVNSMIEDGFVDAAGKPFPRWVHVLNREGEDFYRSIRLAIQSYELGGAHSFLANLLGWMGYSYEELRRDVLESTTPEFAAEAAFVGNGELFARTPQAVKDVAHDVLQRAETKLMARIEAATGRPLREFFPHFVEHGADAYAPWVKEQFRAALIESLRER